MSIVLQETKLTDDKFPHAEIEAAGYQVAVVRPEDLQRRGAAVAHAGQPTWCSNIPGFDDEQARVIAGTVDGVRVIGAYFPNGQAPDSDKFVYKMRWLDALRDWVRGELARHPQLVLMGDFNIAPEDRDVYDPVAWAGQIHCTPRGARAFPAPARRWACTTPSGSSSSRRRAGAGGTTATWRSARTRACASTTSWSARRCSRGCSACAIDKLPRKNERPSDHAPVVGRD